MENRRYAAKRERSSEDKPQKDNEMAYNVSLTDDFSEEFRLPIHQRPTENVDLDNVEQASLDKMLTSSNVGFRLLQKMGWNGKGLGKNEQGITEPIKLGMRDPKLGIGKQEEDDYFTAEENIKRRKLDIEVEDTEENAKKREMMNQESFIRQRISKSTEQLKKQRKENREKEITEVMYQTLGGKILHGLSMMDLNDLGWMIDQNLKEIDKRCETLTNSASSSSSVVVVPEVSAPPPQPLSPPPPPPAEANFMVRNENGVQMGQAHAQQPPWFMDLLNGQDQQQMGFANEEEMMMVPYAGNNNNNNNHNHNHNNNPAWPHGFFP